MASGCVNRPARFFILPDPVTPFCVSATSQAGPNPGVATTTSAGKLIPVQSGDNISSDVNPEYTYEIVSAGGVNSAEWVWTDDSGVYFGKDDPRHWWGYNNPNNAVAWTSNALVYSKKRRRIYLIDQRLSGSMRVYSRSIDSKQYDSWSFVSFPFLNLANNSYDYAAVELDDGSILLAAKMSFGYINVYRSEDPSDSTKPFVLVCERIEAKSIGPSGLLAYVANAQIRMARSGSWIRIVAPTQLTGADPYKQANLTTFVSGDNGASWELISTGASRATPFTEDLVPFDIVGVGDSGTFLLAAVSAGSATPAGRRQLALATAATDGAWLDSGVVKTFDYFIVSISLASSNKYAYMYVYVSDLDATGDKDGWFMGRGEIANLGNTDGSDANGWKWTDFPVGSYLATYNIPAKPMTVWCDEFMCFWRESREKTTGNRASGSAIYYSGNWTERSVGYYGPVVSYADLNGPGWDVQWNYPHGEPSAPSPTAGAIEWSKTVSGTATGTNGYNYLLLSSTSGSVRYSNTGTGTVLGTSDWYEYGVCFRWICRIVSAGPTISVRVFCRNAANTRQRSFRVDMTATTVSVFDIVTSTNIAQITTGISLATVFHEFRLVIDAGGVVILSVYRADTDTWVQVTGTTTSAITLTPQSIVSFGHILTTTGQSYWREFQFTTNGRFMNQEHTSWNQDRLFGALTTAEPQYVTKGLFLSWAGSGGYRGDTWTGNVSYTYPKEAVFVDSPRIAWRSTSLASAQDIIVRAGPSDAVSDNYYTFVHDAVAIFGTNNRYIQIAYDDTETFSSPTATATIDCTLFGGQTFTIASTQRASITLSGSSFPWSTGDLVGCYVENTAVSGAAARITRHLAPGVLQLDSINGDATSAGFPAGNTIVIYAPYGFTTFTRVNERYMRIRVPYWSAVSEGYYTIGTVVAGVKLDVDVPMDWAHTDDEQPNVTSYRTKSGITWAFAEGPAQRTITGRVVGDAEQWRQKFRALLRQVNYEGKAVALGADSGAVFKNIMLGRVKSGSALDNAGYYIDGNGYLRPAGDMSLTFVEEK